MFYFFVIKYFLVNRIPVTEFKTDTFFLIILGSDLALPKVTSAYWLKHCLIIMANTYRSVVSEDKQSRNVRCMADILLFWDELGTVVSLVEKLSLKSTYLWILEAKYILVNKLFQHLRKNFLKYKQYLKYLINTKYIYKKLI